MKMEMYAVKDDLAGFKEISLALNEPIALRDFAYACNTAEIVKLNDKNFSLYKLGVYDTELGTVNGEGCPKLIARADSVIRKAEDK